MAEKELTEGMAANPLDKVVAEDQDVTTFAQEGILTAAAAETDAINQYIQILDLVDRSEPWLGNLVKPTLEDIISEEKKHFAQLSTIVSKLPAFEKEFEMGKEEAETGEDKNEENVEAEETKEEVEESVETEDNATKVKFDLDVIENILINTMNWKMEYIDGVIDELGITDRELYPYEVDKLLSYWNFDVELLDYLEGQIVEKANVENNKAKAAKLDLADDIDTLESLLDPENKKLFSEKAIAGLRELIERLKNEQ